ncbi:ETC complex I subunit conserved region domain-containing protein [Ditylenchus destructor]|nr:ETC complex I subunit conserved region domain-containing protein [Ditylenchus destructor]
MLAKRFFAASVKLPLTFSNARLSLSAAKNNVIWRPPGVETTGQQNLDQNNLKSKAGQSLILRMSEAQFKTLEEKLGEQVKDLDYLVIEGDDTGEVMEIGGVPEEHQEARRARIYQPSRATPQSGSHNTKFWKIELDNQQRWENNNIGWCSSGDPLSNISMALDFASQEDAIHFCRKNRWTYELLEPNLHKIKPKAYGSNFHWSKRTRISTK